MGFFFFFGCIVFPFYAVYIMDKKSKAAWISKEEEASFDTLHEVLYDEFITTLPGYLHYYAVFMYRRIVFIVVAFYFYEEQHTLLQVMVNIISGFLFVLFLVAYLPFNDKPMNYLQACNEAFYVIISYHQLIFTDYARTAKTKVMAGWSMVFVSVFNLLFPNLYMVLAEMLPDIIQNMCPSKKNIKSIINNEEEYREFCESKRKDLIKKYKLTIKEEFADLYKEEEEDESADYPRYN